MVAIAAIGCSQSEVKQPTHEAVTIISKYASTLEIENLNDLEVLEDATHFFVIGDWGRQGYHHQKDMAQMMNQIAMVVEPEFILSTGDHFYDNGVASVDDPLWQSSFENIYDGNLLQIPWYAVLGNHGYRGNVQAQIDYTNVSRRWTMRDRYWFERVPLEDESGFVNFLFLDTSPFEDEYYTEEKYKNVWGQDSTKQLNWMDSTLTSLPQTSWNIAVGHHPLYTGGKRKNNVPYVRYHLESYFDKHNVEAYFCGHEHDIQHIKLPNHPTHHLISGAGAEIRKTGKIEGTQFCVAETAILVGSLTATEMLIQVVNYKGDILYTTHIQKQVK